MMNVLWADFPLLRTKHGLEPIQKVLKDNLSAGVTVALVSLPLNLSLAIASNVHPAVGISTAVWAGMIASIFGSSDYNIFGPAGALSAMITTYTVRWGPDIIAYIGILSACWAALFCSFNVQKYLLIMPSTVFEGFSIAIAVIIGLNQIDMGFGVTKRQTHEHFYENLGESLSVLDEFKTNSVLLFAIETIALLCLMKFRPKVPWIPVMALLTIVVGWVFDPDNGPVEGVELLTLKHKYGVMETDLVRLPRPLGELASAKDASALLVASFSVAFVGVLETILCAKIAGFKVDRPFNELREAGAMTLAHAVCGVVGALPPTGVFLRTALNVNSGATHRMSQGLNALVVLVLGVGLMPIFSYLPQGSVAAILTANSIRMVPYSFLARLWRVDRKGLALCLVVVLLCVMLDPVIGLIIGIVISLFTTASKLNESPTLDLEVLAPAGKGSVQEGEEGQVLRLRVIGSLTFVNGEGVVRKVAGLANPTAVILDLADTRQVDTDGLDQLEKAVGRLLNGKVPCRLEVCGLTKELRPRLQNYKWFQNLESEGLVREGAPTSMTSEKNAPMSEARKFSKTSVASDQCSTRSPSENGILTPDGVPTAPVHAGEAV